MVLGGGTKQAGGSSAHIQKCVPFTRGNKKQLDNFRKQILFIYILVHAYCLAEQIANQRHTQTHRKLLLLHLGDTVLIKTLSHVITIKKGGIVSTAGQLSLT